MVENDPHLKEAFLLPPLVAYKRPQNVRDKLIRAKIPKTEKRTKRNIVGMTKCGNCPICPFIKEGKTVKSTASKFSVDVNKPVNCQSKNILYCIQCDRCRIQYIGESVPFRRGLVSIRVMLKIVTPKSQQVSISVNRDLEFQT